MTRKTLLIALAVAVLLVAGWTYQGRTRWEYKVIYRADLSGDDLRKELSDAGAEGWELIYVRPRNEWAGGDYIFKRPK